MTKDKINDYICYHLTCDLNYTDYDLSDLDPDEVEQILLEEYGVMDRESEEHFMSLLDKEMERKNCY